MDIVDQERTEDLGAVFKCKAYRITPPRLGPNGILKFPFENNPRPIKLVTNVLRIQASMRRKKKVMLDGTEGS